MSSGSEQGLLSLAFDPDYASNGHFYVYYTDPAGDIRLVRYTVSGATPTWPTRRRPRCCGRSPTTLTPTTTAVSSPLALTAGSTSASATAARGRPETTTARTSRSPTPRSGASTSPRPAPKPVLYAYGLRNPWRFSFDRKTGNLWIGDVGQNKWEEIDFLKAGTSPGTNFGWSYYEGDHLYKRQHIVRTRLVFPVTEYSHSFGCAVIGGYVYRGSAITSLRGYYLFADYCSGRVWFKSGPHGASRTFSPASRRS